jgi:hypothetical protein
MAFLKRYAKKAKPHAIDMLAGGPYQASLLAYPKNWKTIVKAKGGSLMCALPANNLIICADGDDAQTAKIVHDEALIAMKKAERPLSSQVISWQDGAWVVVKTPKKD